MTSQWRHRNITHSWYSELNSLQNVYFGFFLIFGKLIEWRCFVTYLWNDPRIFESSSDGCTSRPIFYSLDVRNQHQSNFSLSLCREVADNDGDHAMPEHSVLGSPDELRWAHVILPRRTQTIQILQSLTPPHSPPLYPSSHRQIVNAELQSNLAILYVADILISREMWFLRRMLKISSTEKKVIWKYWELQEFNVR